MKLLFDVPNDSYVTILKRLLGNTPALKVRSVRFIHGAQQPYKLPLMSNIAISGQYSQAIQGMYISEEKAAAATITVPCIL